MYAFVRHDRSRSRAERATNCTGIRDCPRSQSWRRPESRGAAQGIRPARQTDVAAIQELLTPLEQAGITKKRTRRDLYADLQHFTVVEREAKVRLTSPTKIESPYMWLSLDLAPGCCRAILSPMTGGISW